MLEKIKGHFLAFQKNIIVFIFDALIASITFPLAVWIRLGSFNFTELEIVGWQQVFAIIFAVKIISFLIMGMFKGIWRFSSTPDLILIFKTITMATLISVIALFFWNRMETLPRSAFIIDWFLMLVFLGGGRFGYRVWRDGRYKGKREKAIIIGAGEAGDQLIRDFKLAKEGHIEIVAILDDNQLKHNRTIRGVPVLGDISKLPQLIEREEAEHVFVALPQATSKELRKIVGLCSDYNVHVKTLPSLSDIASEKVKISHLRVVNLEDLLGREPVNLHHPTIGEMLSSKIIMVTGAGGSIGSELCRQILKFRPTKLLLFEIGEFFLYSLEMELFEKFPDIEIISIIGDVRDRQQVRETFEQFKPNVIFHAAAYKHVPMMEKNPFMAIKTNVGGTGVIAQEAVNAGVDRFVMVSTDKAVNPTNVMGASKRVAEMVCLNNQVKDGTQFVTVRFGNVIGSTGSVVPLFQKQIEKGGPITVTHPEMTRYFMSIPEAAQLLIQAGSIGNGGEIFVLDMGNPVKIIDMAKDLITLSGYIPEEDIKIEFTGLRPGEKLYEELLADEETTIPTSHPKVRMALARKVISDFDHLRELLLKLSHRNVDDIKQILHKLVPEYTPYRQDDDKVTTEVIAEEFSKFH